MSYIQKNRYVITSLSMFVYAISLSQPVVTAGKILNPSIPNSYKEIIFSALDLLFNGFLGCLAIIVYVFTGKILELGNTIFHILPWFSNILIFITWFYFCFRIAKKNTIMVLFFSLLSLCLASMFLLHSEVYGHTAYSDLKITKIHLGYYLWLTSMAIMFFGSLLIYLLEKNEKK